MHLPEKKGPLVQFITVYIINFISLVSFETTKFATFSALKIPPYGPKNPAHFSGNKKIELLVFQNKTAQLHQPMRITEEQRFMYF